MTVIRGYTTALTLSALLLAPALAQAQAIEVPVERLGDYFYVRATIKKQPVRLVIDSGAGAHILTPEAARRLGLLKEDGQDVQAVGTAGAVSVKQIHPGETEVATAKLNEGLFLAVPLPAVLEGDGLLGYDMFQQYVVTLDYPNNRVTLTAPRDFKPTADAVAVPLRVVKRLPQVELEVDGVKGWFTLDSGASSALDFNTPFVEKNHLRDKYTKRIETPVGRGVGGVTYGDVTRGESVTLGPFKMARPLLQLSRQKTGADSQDDVAGRLGAEILSRFTVTLDYGHNKLYLTKGKDFDTPFVYSRSGLAIDKEDYYFNVIYVIPGSPGAEAGIMVGDQILSVDDMAVNRTDPSKLRERMRSEPGTKVKLLVRTKMDGTPREVTITLRDLI